MKLIARILLVVLLIGTIPVLAQDETEEAVEMDLTGLVNIASTDDGEFLVGPEGMTLYVFDRDQPGVSNCYEQCAANWPALTVESEDELILGEGIPGVLGTTERTDDTLQVTYNGMPLYYFANDENPGDTTGDTVGGVWWIVEPATLYVGGNADLGSFLVGANGMTVYLFTNDEEGVSNCAGQCLNNWPALTVESEDDLYIGRDVPGEVDLIEREDDGTLQVTYNGMPLYSFANDAAPGDATGEGAGDVWYVIAPETVVLGGNDDLGDFLVGPRWMTLYMFTNDEDGVSNCYEQCATNWPPYIVAENDRLTAGEGIKGELSTTERTDGKLQVTYNGMPLYYFAHDTAPGDATGEGAGDVWYVIGVEEETE
jgi:predicted lipoprotein with Yx(FWY)xxD motif